MNLDTIYLCLFLFFLLSIDQLSTINTNIKSMAPIASQESPAVRLAKRYYHHYYSGYNGYSGSPVRWWIALAVVIPILLIVLALLFLARRRNIARHQQGMAPLAYTKWTTFGYNNNQPNLQQPQSYNYNYNNDGYKAEGAVYEDPALPTYNQTAYQPPSGPPPPSSTTAGTNNTSQGYNGEGNVYQRPEGPPPMTSVAYPSQAHSKS